MKVLGQDPATGAEITLRDGRFGAYVQEGEQEEGSAEKPKRASLPKNIRADELTLQQAVALLSLPEKSPNIQHQVRRLLPILGAMGPMCSTAKLTQI